MVGALSSSEYPTMVAVKFQLCSVQITGKCICEVKKLSSPHHPWRDLIIRPHVGQPVHKFAQKSLLHHERLLAFFGKNPPLILIL